MILKGNEGIVRDTTPLDESDKVKPVFYSSIGSSTEEQNVEY